MTAGSRAARIGREALALGLAHAVAVVLVSHCHYFFSPPTRLLWFGVELGLAALAWWPCRWYVRGVLVPAYTVVGRHRWLFVAVPAGLGIVVSRWWAGSLADTLWVHEPAILGAMQVLLAGSQAAVLAAGYAGLLAVTVFLDRPVPADEPDDHRQGGGSLGAFPAFVLFFAAANAFTVWYVSQERAVYYWDYMGYWAKAGELASALQGESPGAIWDRLRYSTRTEDYGPAPALPPALAIAAFGDTRLVYELAVVNLYLGGLAAAAWLFARRFGPASGSLGSVVPVLAVLLSPLAWVPVVRGYLDVGGAALAVLALLVYLSSPAGRLPWQRILLLAALLVAMVLFRRWYSFFVVAFFLVAGADTVIAVVRALRSGWAEAARVVARLLMVGIWAAVLLVSFAADWVRRAATTDYAADYAAYKTLVPLSDRVSEWVSTNGPAYVAGAVTGFLVLLVFRDTRRVSLVIGSMVPVMVVHFLSVQNFGPHHDYLFLPAFVLLPALALVRVLGGAPGWQRWACAGVFAAVGSVLCAVMFLPVAQPLRGLLKPAVSTWYYPPLERGDLDEFRRLLRDTEAAAGSTERGTVTVVASSLVLNGSMFQAADRSLGESLIRRERIVLDPDIDVGFPGAILKADVAVVAVPTQTHLRPSEQQGVVLVADSLLGRRDVGAAFERVEGEYQLGEGVRVRLYRRTRATRPEELDAFCERLREAHSDRPVFFTPPPDVRHVVETRAGKARTTN